MAISGLKRVLGLPEVSFIAVGMTIGGGIFVFTGIVLKITGPALPVAYALAVVLRPLLARSLTRRSQTSRRTGHSSRLRETGARMSIGRRS